MTISTIVREFHQTFGAVINDKPDHLLMHDYALTQMRLGLILEEADELFQAIDARDYVETADALGDLAYVTYGAALSLGIPLYRVVSEIHRSNMTKLGPDGKPIYRADGKILKGPNFEPPQLRPLLNLAP